MKMLSFAIKAIAFFAFMFAFTILLSSLNEKNFAHGEKPGYGFYVAIAPGEQGRPFDLVLFDKAEDGRSYLLPDKQGRQQTGKYERAHYKVITSDRSSQVIETTFSTDDYTFSSRYRATAKGFTPLWQKTLGPDSMIAAIPLAIVANFLLFWLIRRSQATAQGNS